ncbi:interleukin-20 receptor subunit beta isoform X2 [Bombina bombina]|uniref:interleukin-20 receptor subunit beta isoform X2 n=1 Tax=Bombina bombina TaxID=8345 RepID=UPI00235AEF06|nr:interleukin-20 receptor subunit beta isoform X2 [Bombina bombina]
MILLQQQDREQHSQSKETEEHDADQGQALLPFPENISMESINLKHFLSWNPVPVSWGNVTYSVQFQGEYERRYKNQSWNEAVDCQAIVSNWCNLTKDIATNVPYKLRVRTEIENQTSDWKYLQPYFIRSSTHLTQPVIQLRARGLNLFVDVQDLGPYFKYFVFYWRKGQEDVEYSLTSNVNEIHLGAMESGSQYCVQVIAHAYPIEKNSSTSLPDCIAVQSTGLTDKIISYIFTFCAIIAGLVLMPLLSWYMIRRLHYICCPQVDVPNTLMDPYCPKENIVIQFSKMESYDLITSIELTEKRSFLVPKRDFTADSHPK